MHATAYSFQELSLMELPGEKWKDIPDTDGRYQISDKGRARRTEYRSTSVVGASVVLPALIICQQVKSKATADGKFRFLLEFSITIGGKRKHFGTARLVYGCFVDASSIGRKDRVVLYRDDDPLNVNVENLYLGTLQEKARLAAQRLGSHTETVGQYTLDGQLIRTYTSVAEAAAAVGRSPSTIRDALNQRSQLTSADSLWCTGDAPYVSVSLPEPKTTAKPKTAAKPRSAAKPKTAAPRKNTAAAVSSKVSRYNYEGVLLHTYVSINEASRETTVSRSSIQRVLKGEYISAGGYLWAYGDSLRIDLQPFKQRPNFAVSSLGKHLLEKRRKNLEKLGNRMPATVLMSDFDKGKRVVAHNLMVEFGFTDEQVSQATEFSIDEIKRLREELN